MRLSLNKDFRRLARTIRKCLTQREDRLQAKQRFAALVAELAENGQVAAVHSGMDCDGMSWSNRVCLLPAIPVKIERWADEFYRDAEGPQHFYLAKPSDAADLQATWRDRGLEAFEDGHPHILHA